MTSRLTTDSTTITAPAAILADGLRIAGLPEQQHDAIGESSEIVVPIYSGFWI